MRAIVCFVFALLSMQGARASDLSTRVSEPVKPSLAAPAAPDPPMVAFSQHAPFAAMRHPDLPLLGPDRPLPGGYGGGFSIGPIHADAVTRFSGRSGKAHMVPHYRVEGVTVFGGSIGGSIDGRGGMVTLNWHTGP
jgi:hypothetical protein